MYLIFRPKNKISYSQKAFGDANLDAIGVALHETVAVADCQEKLQRCLESQPDFIIITSTAAAQLMRDCANTLANGKVIAVGDSTAAVLAEGGIQTSVPQQHSSEGVLDMPCLQHVHGKRVVIAKGEGGRGLLNDTLSMRQASVEELNLYRRQILKHPLSTQSWQPDQIHCIIATSGEQIMQAFEHFTRDWLRSLPWIVVSQRTAEIAATLGVTSITTSAGASDDALIQTARHIRES